VNLELQEYLGPRKTLQVPLKGFEEYLENNKY
jgi:hypothetical protein